MYKIQCNIAVLSTRQNGLGYTNFMTRLGVSAAPLILLLEDTWTVLPQIIICTAAITSGLVSLLLPETHNVRLPESIDDVEKPRLVFEYIQMSIIWTQHTLFSSTRRQIIKGFDFLMTNIAFWKTAYCIYTVLFHFRRNGISMEASGVLLDLKSTTDTTRGDK